MRVHRHSKILSEKLKTVPNPISQFTNVVTCLRPLYYNPLVVRKQLQSCSHVHPIMTLWLTTNHYHIAT